MKHLMMAIVCILTVINAGYTQELWSTDVSAELIEINWLHQSTDGIILVNGPKGMLGINPENGEVIWNNEGLKAIDKATLRTANPYPFVTVDKTNLTGKKSAVIFYTANGEEILDSQDEEFKLFNSTLLPEQNILLLEIKEDKMYKLKCYALDKQEFTWTTPIAPAKKGLKGLMKNQNSILARRPRVDDKYIIVQYEKTVSTIDRSSGSVLWQKEFDKKPSGIQTRNGKVYIGVKDRLVVIDKNNGTDITTLKLRGNDPELVNLDSDVLIYHDKGLNILNSQNDQLKWEKPDKTIRPTEVYAMDDGYLGTSTYEEGVTYFYMDNNGKKRWKKSKDGNLYYSFPLDKGLFYITDKNLNVLDYQKGDEKIKKSIKIKNMFAASYDDKNDDLVIYTDNKLYTYNLTSHKVDLLNEELKLEKFNAEDYPLTLEMRKERYFLYTSNHAALIKRNGDVVYNKYMKPVKTSALAQISKDVARGYGVDVDGITASANAMNSLSKGAFITGKKSTSADVIAEEKFSISSGNNKLYGASSLRYDASQSLPDTHLIYGKGDGSKDLIRVQKDTGATDTVLSFEDKNPTYIIDNFLNIIVSVQGNKVTAHKF